MKKALNILNVVFHVILLGLYIGFIYVVSTMFSIFPWYDRNALYLINMLYLWLPLSVVTIITLTIRFITKSFEYIFVCLSALNAIYIPILFVLGFIDHPFALTAVICIIACVTMVVYFVAYIKRLIKTRAA